MKKLILLFLLVIAGWFLLRSCSGSRKEVTTYTPPAIPAGTPKAIPQAEAIPGSTLNKAFPGHVDGYKMTFTQEKDGFAQADLAQNGARVATLSISDTNASPTSRDKFKDSKQQIAGYPAAAVGSQGTAVLVVGRFQVQVRSVAPAFKDTDREAWLARFKLAELARAK
jgi:hypothetical protein